MDQARRRAGLWRDTRGAVYVEFLIAFMPVFVFFLCLLQLALLFSSQLLVEHSATTAARSAAVVFGDEAGPYAGYAPGAHDEVNALTAPRRQAVRDAVLVSLAPLILDGSIAAVNVAYPSEDAPGGADQPEGAALRPMTHAGPAMIRVRVEADVVCKIAMANLIACGGAPGAVRVKTIAAESLFPYQGARYAYE